MRLPKAGYSLQPDSVRQTIRFRSLLAPDQFFMPKIYHKSSHHRICFSVWYVDVLNLYGHVVGSVFPRGFSNLSAIVFAAGIPAKA